VQYPGEPIPTLYYEGFEKPAPPIELPPGWFVIDATVRIDPDEIKKELEQVRAAKNQEKEPKGD
jgi:hypothetical protein